MPKNRILIVCFIAIVLTLVVLAIVSLVSKNTSPSSSATQNQQEMVITQEPRVSPASIVSVSQTGEKFSILGTGFIGSEINISHNDAVLATSVVNPNGEWSLDLTATIMADTMVLNVLMVTPSGYQVLSDQKLIIINPTSKPEISTPHMKSNKLVLRVASGRNTRVLQTSFARLPGQDGFVMEAIDYDNSGGVIFSGMSVRMGRVKIYANGNLVGESHVDRSGRWNLIFGNIMPMGKYNLSVEFVPTAQEGIQDTIAEPIILTFPFARMDPLFEAENSPKILVEHLQDRIQIGRALYAGGYQFTVIYSPDAVLDK